MTPPARRAAGLAALPLLLLVGCLAPAGQTPSEESAPTANGAWPRPDISRIVSLAPSLTTVVLDVGLGDRLVAVDSYSWGVPESLPRVGGLYDPDVEMLLRLRPTLVVGLPSHADLKMRLAGLKAEWLLLPSETLPDLQEAIAALSRLVGPSADGVQAAVRKTLGRGRTRARQAHKEACLPLAPEDCPKQRILLVIGRRPGSLQGMTVAGPKVFLAELLRMLEAEPLPPGSAALWPQIGAEEILRLAPDQIWELGAAVSGQELCCHKGSRFAPYLALTGVPAVENRAFVLFRDERMLVPGTNVVDTLAAFQEALWPGLPHPATPLSGEVVAKALPHTGDG